MSLRQGKAQMLTIYLGESDQWRGRSLYVAIIQLLREQGGAGATVTRAVAGYGAGARLHEQKGFQWSSDAPLIISVVDQPARLQRVIPQLQEMMNGGVMTLHDVDVLKYTHARRQGISGKLPVRQVMETNVTVVHLDTAVSTVVNVLLAAPFRVLPVVDEQQKLQGILSTGDLINADLLPMRRGLVRTASELDQPTADAMEHALERAEHSTLTAQDIMNRQVRTIAPDQSIQEAARMLIETRLRNLPVIDTSGILLGMVTRADLLHAIRTSPLMSSDASSATQPLQKTHPLPRLSLQQQPITVYTTREVVTVEEGTPFAEVIDALVTSPIKRVLVVDADRRVKGIIGDVDVLEGIEENARPGFLAVLSDWTRGKRSRMPTGALRSSSGKPRVAADVMNRNVVTIADTATVQEAIERMMATRRKVLPVIDQEERLVGTVGRFDVLRILVGSQSSS
jgi:CBS-domain-containing membrane protein